MPNVRWLTQTEVSSATGLALNQLSFGGYIEFERGEGWQFLGRMAHKLAPMVFCGWRPYMVSRLKSSKEGFSEVGVDILSQRYYYISEKFDVIYKFFRVSEGEYFSTAPNIQPMWISFFVRHQDLSELIFQSTAIDYVDYLQLKVGTGLAKKEDFGVSPTDVMLNLINHVLCKRSVIVLDLTMPKGENSVLLLAGSEIKREQLIEEYTEVDNEGIKYFMNGDFSINAFK